MLKVTQPIPLPEIAGEGYVLRAYRQSDIVSLQKHMNDERVARDVSHIPFPYTIEHAQSWIDQTEAEVTVKSHRVDFVIDVDGEVAGSVAFINVDQHKAQISTWISPLYWRRGLASNALRQLIEFGFRTLGLVRIYAYHYSENLKTAGLLEKVGFKFEGVHEKEWLKVIGGKVRLYDSNYYSIVYEESKVRTVVISQASGEGYGQVSVIADELTALLGKVGIAVVSSDAESGMRPDLAISLGGDGTMMRSVATFSSRGIPTLGINAGDVGFLTSAESSELDDVVARIVKGDFTVERRTALRFEYSGEVYGPFANEVSLLHPTRGIASFEVSINDDVFFEKLSADGVLVATATGSTAYNASAGGSIMTPEVSSVIINALNPPTFNMRSVVTDKLTSGGKITLRVVGSKRDEPLTIAADYLQIADGPKVGESIVITRHPQPLLFATFGNAQYIEALKGKMNLVR